MKKQHLKKYLFSGLAVFLPLVFSIYVCAGVLAFAESIFGKYLRPFLLDNYDFYIPGIGLAVLFLVVLLCGILVTHYLGTSFKRITDDLLGRIPLLGTVYSAFKEIARFVFREEGHPRPQMVVLVEWPREGCYTIGFLTNTSPAVVRNLAGQELVNVLIPTVPNPLTGFVAMLPRPSVRPLPMTVEEAVRLIVSGGVIDPHALAAADASPAA